MMCLCAVDLCIHVGTICGISLINIFKSLPRNTNYKKCNLDTNSLIYSVSLLTRIHPAGRCRRSSASKRPGGVPPPSSTLRGLVWPRRSEGWCGLSTRAGLWNGGWLLRARRLGCHHNNSLVKETQKCQGSLPGVPLFPFG